MADGRDAVADNPNISHEPGSASAVDDVGPCDYEIVIRLLCVAKHGSEQRSDQCEGRNQSGDHAHSRNLELRG